MKCGGVGEVEGSFEALKDVLNKVAQVFEALDAFLIRFTSLSLFEIL